MRKKEPDWGRAIHEAAHAIVACYLKVQIHEVTIVSDSDSAGSTTLTEAIHDRRSDLECRNVATVHLAARAAVELLCPRYGREEHYKSDERNAFDASQMECSSDEDLRIFQEWRAETLARTREIVRWPHIRKSIRTLAKKLQQNRTVPADVVQQIFKSCLRNVPSAEKKRFAAIEQRFRRRIRTREARTRRKLRREKELPAA